MISKSYKVVVSLRENCPNTEFFLVRIFPHSNWISKDTPYLETFRAVYAFEIFLQEKQNFKLDLKIQQLFKRTKSCWVLRKKKIKISMFLELQRHCQNQVRLWSLTKRYLDSCGEKNLYNIMKCLLSLELCALLFFFAQLRTINSSLKFNFPISIAYWMWYLFWN